MCETSGHSKSEQEVYFKAITSTKQKGLTDQLFIQNYLHLKNCQSFCQVNKNFHEDQF